MKDTNLGKYKACADLRIFICSDISTVIFQVLFIQINTHWLGFQENRILVNKNILFQNGVHLSIYVFIYYYYVYIYLSNLRTSGSFRKKFTLGVRKTLFFWWSCAVYNISQMLLLGIPWTGSVESILRSQTVITLQPCTFRLLYLSRASSGISRKVQTAGDKKSVPEKSCFSLWLEILKICKCNTVIQPMQCIVLL